MGGWTRSDDLLSAKKLWIWLVEKGVIFRYRLARPHGHSESYLGFCCVRHPIKKYILLAKIPAKNFKMPCQTELQFEESYPKTHIFGIH